VLAGGVMPGQSQAPLRGREIVPPAAASATPVFHRYYDDVHQTPNFCRHPDLPELAMPG
jgi:hypothetical protein